MADQMVGKSLFLAENRKWFDKKKVNETVAEAEKLIIDLESDDESDA